LFACRSLNCTRIIRRSPVGDPELWLYKHPQRGYIDFLSFKDAPPGYTGGRFRANWQASINAPIKGTIDTDKNPETNASKAISSVKSAAKKKGALSYYLMNNLPYAKRLEDGHSSQAPNGIVKLAAAEWKSIVRIVSKMVK